MRRRTDNEIQALQYAITETVEGLASRAEFKDSPKMTLAEDVEETTNSLEMRVKGAADVYFPIAPFCSLLLEKFPDLSIYERKTAKGDMERYISLPLEVEEERRRRGGGHFSRTGRGVRNDNTPQRPSLEHGFIILCGEVLLGLLLLSRI